METKYYKGLCIGGAADGMVAGTTNSPEYRHHLPLEPSVIPGPAEFDPLAKHKPAYELYRYIELQAANRVFAEVDGFGFWVPEAEYNYGHKFLFTELIKAYQELREPRPGIHAEIKEQCELAQTYAEDGAFYTAGKRLMALGERLVMHAERNADEIDAARSGEAPSGDFTREKVSNKTSRTKRMPKDAYPGYSDLPKSER